MVSLKIKRMIKIKNSLALLLILFSCQMYGQTAYFADGFHGGTVGGGGYPDGYTEFMVQALKAHPHWKINLEIEPGTWDTVQADIQSTIVILKIFFQIQPMPAGLILQILRLPSPIC